MPIVPSTLSALITNKVASQMEGIQGTNPLNQQNPSYFQGLCTGVATGIAAGLPSIPFTTNDQGVGGSPSVTGNGSGIGVIMDAPFTTQAIYNYARSFVLADFGKTLHDPYPPGPGNSGLFLLAICQGISEATQEHFSTCFNLVGKHPAVYSGTATIDPGMFSGISSSALIAGIVSGAPMLKGAFWPRLAQAIGLGLYDSITQKATGQLTISGVCVLGPSQVCGVPGSGKGSGSAS